MDIKQLGAQYVWHLSIRITLDMAINDTKNSIYDIKPYGAQ